ncbi:unnamed protein product [Parnassius apollo]|uniref:(apollo) hypothetical protein n=1 Tax=Parnassius apollo TaxID=110799 RepID=A0A8S3WVS2_PARAO|nr:unnamed protein product [Parnassius apollo]
MKSKLLYDSLMKDISKSELRQQIPQLPEHASKHHQAISSPIKDQTVKSVNGGFSSHMSSVLLDHPFVQKNGRNDYLVMQPQALDPYVTVIPNDIYYNHEKTCVNWLEECNAQGIRAKLLQKLRSPYM